MTTKKNENNLLQKAVLKIGFFDIGWRRFPISFRKGKALSTDELELLGSVDFDLLEIFILSDLPSKILQHTLSHECWHVLLSTLGIRSNTEDVEKELILTNEFITEQIARGIGIFKRLNPELWILLYDNTYD